MRRKDRQITDLEAIRAILDKAKVLHLAMIDGARPYVVPMNYGYALAAGRLTLYLQFFAKFIFQLFSKIQHLTP